MMRFIDLVLIFDTGHLKLGQVFTKL